MSSSQSESDELYRYTAVMMNPATLSKHIEGAMLGSEKKIPLCLFLTTDS